MDTRCAGDMRINFVDIGETIAQRRRRAGVYKNSGPAPERRSTISTMTSSYQVTRSRNLSGGSNGSTASGSSSGSSTQLDNQYSTDNQLYFSLDISPFANSTADPQNRDDSSSSHRKLDRSLSDSDSDRSGHGSSHRSVNSSRYKTELCRPFEESGSCKYGDKCQFAHGSHELRNLARHPKYKTELCRTFHTIGFCPYGPRCHFVHEDDKIEGTPKLAESESSSPSLSPTGNENNFSYCSESTSQMNIENAQINNSLTVHINYNGVDLQSLEQRFNSALNLNNNCNESSRNVSNSSCKAEEYDIFSSISVFNADEVVANASKPSTSTYSSYSNKQTLDNYPTYVDTNCFWQPSVSSQNQNMAPVDPFHYSPTGSTGSSSSSGSDSGSSSDCSGSTESLAGSGYPEWRRPPMPFDLVY